MKREFEIKYDSLLEINENRSLYKAYIYKLDTINKIKDLLNSIRKKNNDSSHVCYAYRIKMGDRLDEFYSDAGEPKGSAGKPILNALKRNNLINSVIFVIRYFGGTKLGIPGLIHAYGTAAQEVIKNARIKQWNKKKGIGISYPYDLEGVMKSLFQKNKTEVIHENFGAKINVQLEIDLELADGLIEDIKEISSGVAKVIMNE